MKKAFTFIELIVVITILAILGTIAFVSVKEYKSYNEECIVNNLSQISKGVQECPQWY